MVQRLVDKRVPNEKTKQSQNNYCIGDHKRFENSNTQNQWENTYLKPFGNLKNNFLLCHNPFY